MKYADVNALLCELGQDVIIKDPVTGQERADTVIRAADLCGDKVPSPWISVKERLPEYERKVLAFVKNKNPEGRYNKDGIYVAQLEDKIPQPDPKGKRNFWGLPGYDSEWAVWSWSYFSEPEVTHWMPLPDPPEVEE